MKSRKRGRRIASFPTPVSEFIQPTFVSIGNRYSSTEPIISIMRDYAQRKLAAHPVKQYFDEGNHTGLRLALLRDYNNAHFLGDRSERKEVMSVLDKVASRFFKEWSWEEGGYTQRSVAMKKLRRGYVE
jgi:hypothetical protein